MSLEIERIEEGSILQDSLPTKDYKSRLFTLLFVFAHSLNTLDIVKMKRCYLIKELFVLPCV